MKEDEKLRRLDLDLDRVTEALRLIPDPSEDEEKRAERARRLLDAIIHGVVTDEDGTQHELSGSWLLTVTEEEFNDAHSVVAGGEGRPALQAAAEDLAPEVFDGLVAGFSRLSPVADPGVGDELA